jgi:hypothetical protein
MLPVPKIELKTPLQTAVIGFIYLWFFDKLVYMFFFHHLFTWKGVWDCLVSLLSALP